MDDSSCECCGNILDPQSHSVVPQSTTGPGFFNDDVSKDGQRFLVNRYAKPQQVAPLHLVLYAMAGMRK
jgi:hypothetical protein